MTTVYIKPDVKIVGAAPSPSLCAVSGLVAGGASCSGVAQSESERRDDNT